MEQKTLKLKQHGHDSENDVLFFSISEQSHRVQQFGNNARNFKATNEVILTSAKRPEIGGCENRFLYMRGHLTILDNCILETTEAGFEKYKDACQEYNDFFSLTELQIAQQTIERMHTMFSIMPSGGACGSCKSRDGTTKRCDGCNSENLYVNWTSKEN